MSKQPEALRLADELKAGNGWHAPSVTAIQSSDELRRLHAINAELMEALGKFVSAAAYSSSALDFSISCDGFIQQARAALAKAKEQQ